MTPSRNETVCPGATRAPSRARCRRSRGSCGSSPSAAPGRLGRGTGFPDSRRCGRWSRWCCGARSRAHRGRWRPGCRGTTAPGRRPCRPWRRWAARRGRSGGGCVAAVGVVVGVTSASSSWLGAGAVAGDVVACRLATLLELRRAPTRGERQRAGQDERSASPHVQCFGRASADPSRRRVGPTCHYPAADESNPASAPQRPEPIDSRRSRRSTAICRSGARCWSSRSRS